MVFSDYIFRAMQIDFWMKQSALVVTNPRLPAVGFSTAVTTFVDYLGKHQGSNITWLRPQASLDKYSSSY